MVARIGVYLQREKIGGVAPNFASCATNTNAFIWPNSLAGAVDEVAKKCFDSADRDRYEVGKA